MGDSPRYWDIALQSAKRAVSLEGVDNISFAYMKQTDVKSFEVDFGFYADPTDEDLEALSLIETEIVSDIWGWVDNFHYTWSVCSHPSEDNKRYGTMVFLDSN